MAEAYIPLHAPFYDDGEFRVYERSEGHFTATRVNGAVHYQGDLRGCARWIESQKGR